MTPNNLLHIHSQRTVQLVKRGNDNRHITAASKLSSFALEFTRN